MVRRGSGSGLGVLLAGVSVAALVCGCSASTVPADRAALVRATTTTPSLPTSSATAPSAPAAATTGQASPMGPVEGSWYRGTLTLEVRAGGTAQIDQRDCGLGTVTCDVRSEARVTARDGVWTVTVTRAYLVDEVGQHHAIPAGGASTLSHPGDVMTLARFTPTSWPFPAAPSLRLLTGVWQDHTSLRGQPHTEGPSPTGGLCRRSVALSAAEANEYCL